MDSILANEPTAEEAVQIKREIELHLAEIDRIREQMREDQKEIRASGVRTDAKLAQINSMLDQLRESYRA